MKSLVRERERGAAAESCRVINDADMQRRSVYKLYSSSRLLKRMIYCRFYALKCFVLLLMWL